MEVAHKDQNDKALHRSEIEMLARKIGKPIALVETVYEAEYARLKCAAKVTNYLGVLASRCTREALRRSH
jgi:hypothetical protein